MLGHGSLLASYFKKSHVNTGTGSTYIIAIAVVEFLSCLCSKSYLLDTVDGLTSVGMVALWKSWR